MKSARSLITAACVCFFIAFSLLGLELTHVVPSSQLYSLAILFAFIVAGFLMMLAFSRKRNEQE
jgi:predicted tellurium resistance membrane protein TerC